jgi:hypothetical protein
MGKHAKLYVTLLEMLDAAEGKSKKNVVAVNQRFSPAYNHVMPRNYEPNSPADLYDKARNKLINSIDDNFSYREQREELRDAKKILSKIKKMEYY